MRRRRITPELVRSVLRSRICAGCEWRTRDDAWRGSDGKRSCESECCLFRHLNQIQVMAENLDPMLNSGDAIEHFCRSPHLHKQCPKEGCPLQQYATKVACEVDRIVNM